MRALTRVDCATREVRLRTSRPTARSIDAGESQANVIAASAIQSSTVRTDPTT